MANTNTLREALLAEDNTKLRLLINYWDVVKEVLNSEGEKPFTQSQVLDGDSKILNEEIAKEIKTFYASVLDLLECGLSEDDELFKAMRGKILRAGNDAIRNTEKMIKNYHVLKVMEQTTVFKAEFTNGKVNKNG